MNMVALFTERSAVEDPLANAGAGDRSTWSSSTWQSNPLFNANKFHLSRRSFDSTPMLQFAAHSDQLNEQVLAQVNGTNLFTIAIICASSAAVEAIPAARTARGDVLDDPRRAASSGAIGQGGRHRATKPRLGRDLNG